MGLPNQMWHCTGIDMDGVPHYVDVAPALAAYEVGLVTQEKKLANPLISAFWQALD